MKTILFLTLMLSGSLVVRSATLDVEAVGRELNGWDDSGAAVFGAGGGVIRALKPGLRNDGEGGLEVTMRVEQRNRGAVPYAAMVRLGCSPDGIVRSASIDGTLNGNAFSTGEVSRPEAVVPAEGGEAAAAGEVDVTPVNPERQMMDELAERLQSALEKSAESKKQVNRDVASRIFGGAKSDPVVAIEGTMPVIRALFRRLGP